MIIGVCGFTSTGSSAVVDYLKEYDNLSTVDNMECTITYYPDGIEDLDYQLNVACSKYTASVVAIERFRRHVHNFFIMRTGSQKRREEIQVATEKFLDSIVQVRWKGYGSSDFQIYSGKNYKSKFSMFFTKLSRWIIVPRLEKISPKDHDFFIRHTMEYSIQPENFDVAAKKYVSEFLMAYGADFSKDVVLNQPFCGNNPQKSFKYYENPIAIIVDRDPRDNYVFAKKFLRRKGRQIPTDRVEDFVEYYKRMRDGQPYKNDDQRILRIQFEDMVYKYNDTCEIIDRFCGLNHSDRSKTLFVPEMSINNTQVYKRYPELSRDIEYIEENLKEYLYPFEEFGERVINGKMFSGKSPLNK